MRAEKLFCHLIRAICDLIALQVPSNIVLKRLRPSLWLSGLMLLWGIMMVRLAASPDLNAKSQWLYARLCKVWCTTTVVFLVSLVPVFDDHFSDYPHPYAQRCAGCSAWWKLAFSRELLTTSPGTHISHCLSSSHLLSTTLMMISLHSWYKRSEYGIRIAIFFTAASISGAFGGLLVVRSPIFHRMGDL